MLKKRAMSVCLACISCILSGCSIFPEEEELRKTPIIQAYEQEPFRKVEVQRGELKQYEKVEAVCMSVGEKQYSFSVSDCAYQGIYVTQGEKVEVGKVLAELMPASGDGPVQLVAEHSGTVTFVKNADENEKSISGQIVAVINENQGYYLNAYTKYWDKFEQGQEVVMRIRGHEYSAVVINPEDIGLNPVVRPQSGEESQVYFHVVDEEAYMQSGDSGEVTILVEDKKDVLYVSKGSVTLVNDKPVVYVEDENGIRNACYIETGIETDKYVEVTDGLKEGDKVIVE